MIQKIIWKILFWIIIFIPSYYLQAGQPNTSLVEQAARNIFSSTMPTVSGFEPVIDSIYGTSGLNIDPQNLIKIKQTYCYLEFLTKLDKARNDIKFTSYKKKFEAFLPAKSKNQLLTPSQSLVQSDVWKAIKVTPQDIIAGGAWQNFVKAMICDSIDNDTTFLETKAQLDNQLLAYTSNIETSFGDDDFIAKTAYRKALILQAQLRSNNKSQYIAQCIDWKNTNVKNLVSATTLFKQSEFYCYTHPLAAGQSLPAIIASPTREQIVAYYMITTIQGIIYDLMNGDNFYTIIKQTSILTFRPNFFIYTIDDAKFVKQLIFEQNVITKNKKSGDQTDASSTVSNNDVKIQSAASSNSDLESSVLPNNKNSLDQAIALLYNDNLPTKSIYQSKLQKIYGPSGLNIPASDLIIIQKTYCYLEFLIKIDTIKAQPSLITSSSIFTPFITPSSEHKPNMPTAQLVNSADWDAIVITQQDFVASQYWQTFLKLMITNFADNDAQYLETMLQTKNQLFSYLTNIETAYCDATFIALNNFAQVNQLTNQLQQIQKKRYLSQCSDWKNSSMTQLQEKIVEFKTTEIYKTLYQSDQSTTAQITTDISVIIANFMLTNIQSTVNKLLRQETLLAFLTQANSPDFVVNFFPYQLTDFNLLSAFLSKSESLSTSKIALQNEPTFSDASNDGSVVIQTVDHKKNDKHKDKIKESKKTKRELKRINKDMLAPTKLFIKCVTKMSQDLTKAFIQESAGLTFMAESMAKVSDPKINPRAEENKVMKKLDEHAGTLDEIFEAGIYASASIVLVTFGGIYGVAAVASTSAATVEIYHKQVEAGVKKYIGNPMMKVIEPIIKGMAVLTNDITTAFIKITDECTLIDASILKGFGDKINPQEEEAKINAKLEKYRCTINTAVGVALTVAISAAVIVCTAGVGAAAAVSADAVEATALTAADIAAQTAAKETVELAAKQAAELAAKQAVQKTAEETAKTAATEEATATAQAAAKETVELQAKQASELAAKQEEEAVAKKTAEAATKKVADKSAEPKTFGAKLGAGITKDLSGSEFALSQGLNVGMGAFSVAGQVTQDQTAAIAAQNERESIINLAQFVESNKIVVTQDQEFYLDELQKKHQAAVENQLFGLQYYSNYLNGSVDNLQDQIAQSLAQEYIAMLTPDSHEIKLADIGSSWALATPFVYLYPSQGFLTTTLGRKDFPYAQEIAQAPLTSARSGSDQSPGKTLGTATIPSVEKLWFNQRAMAVTGQPADQPLNVHMKFRIIYNLASDYHVGIYLGGKYHDYNSAQYLASIQDTGSVDIDDAHCAKMFVLKQDIASGTVQIGVYEHEGKGWIANHPIDSSLIDAPSIFNMSATLNNDQLTISFWPENNLAAQWSTTVTVTPCDQRTFGVIFSGVAVEWNCSSPDLKITENPTLRASLDGVVEADREKKSKAAWKTLLNPTFGKMNLKSLGKDYIVRGQYLYTTQDTSLMDVKNQPIQDYLIFANTTDGTISQIGTSAIATSTTSAPNNVISLVTGNVYDESANLLSQKTGLYAIYAQKFGPLKKECHDNIMQAQSTYFDTLMTTSFGTYTLQAYSRQALLASQFVYSCKTTINVKDVDHKEIIDYLVMAQIVDGGLGSVIGMAPASNVQGMLSLVTGNLYDTTNASPIAKGYYALDSFKAQHGNLSPEILSAITKSTNAYNKVLAKNNQEKAQAAQVQATAIASATVSISDMSQSIPVNTGGFQFGLTSKAPAKLKSTTASLSQRQTNAAGGLAIQLKQAPQPS